MSHYKDGTKAELFDTVRFPSNGRMAEGVLVDIQPGSTTCNGMIQFTKAVACARYDENGSSKCTIDHQYTTQDVHYATIGECELAMRYVMDEKGKWTYMMPGVSEVK